MDPQMIKVIVHMHSSACLIQQGTPLLDPEPQMFPWPCRAISMLPALPVLTILLYEPSTLKAAPVVGICGPLNNFAHMTKGF